jgi:hypothetical protein
MQEMAAEHEAYQQRTLDQIRELEREEGLL